MSWKRGEKLSGHYSGNPRRNEGGRHSKPCRVCGGSGKVGGTGGQPEDRQQGPPPGAM